MQQPPFPFVLVLLTAFFGWFAVTESSGWVPWASGVGAIVCGAAAVYQSRPQREPGDEITEDDLPGEH